MKKKTKCIAITFSFLLLILIISNEPVCASPASGITDYYTYNLANKNSGKYLNVNYGTDANGTNVTQYTNDGSVEQKFAVVYNSNMDAYRLFAVCSDEGHGRVLDVLRTGGSSSGSIVSGCNVDIWATGDDTAQYWKIINRGNGYYSLNLASNQNLALTAIGMGNGSGAGTSSSSTGNVIVQTYTGANNQLWSFVNTPVLWNYYLVDSSKHLDWSISSNYSRFFSIGVNTWNAYKSGVIRGPYSSLTSDVDVAVSDYYEVSIVTGVTNYAERTIKLNSYNMDRNTENEKIKTCTHEIGHALGLDHRRDPECIMYRSSTSITFLDVMDKWNYDKSYARF